MAQFMKRASSHEAGHIIVAFKLGLRVECVRVQNGLPLTDVWADDLDATGRAAEDRYAFLAGGIAGEKVIFGDYDRKAMQDDQNKITQRGGGRIDDYLQGALSIVEASKSCVDRLRQTMTLNWVSAQAEAQFSSDPDSYEILSGVELMHILQNC
jgi:hypothetical protein